MPLYVFNPDTPVEEILVEVAVLCDEIVEVVAPVGG